MGENVGQWLVEDFTVLGIHLQHWMPVALVIVVLAVAYARWRPTP